MRQEEWVTYGAACRDGLRRRLGAERGCRRVLVAARRFSAGRVGDGAERYGVIRGCWRTSFPPDDGAFFAERMTVRLGGPPSPETSDDLSRPPEGRPPRGSDVTSRRETTTRWCEPGADPCLAPDRGAALLVPHGSQLERKGRGAWLRTAPTSRRCISSARRGGSHRSGGGLLRVVRRDRRGARPRCATEASRSTPGSETL